MCPVLVQSTGVWLQRQWPLDSYWLYKNYTIYLIFMNGQVDGYCSWTGLALRHFCWPCVKLDTCHESFDQRWIRSRLKRKKAHELVSKWGVCCWFQSGYSKGKNQHLILRRPRMVPWRLDPACTENINMNRPFGAGRYPLDFLNNEGEQAMVKGYGPLWTPTRKKMV